MSDNAIEASGAGGAALRGGILRAASFGGGLLLGLAAAPLIVRHLGDVDFGHYSTVLAVIAIMTGLTEGGINTIALRELSEADEPAVRDQAMRELLGLRIVLSTVAVALAVAFSALAGYGPTLVLGTLIAGLGMFAMVLQTLVATVLQSRLRFGWAAIIDLLRQGIVTALIVALVLAGGGVLSFLAIGLPAGLAALLVTVLLVRGTITLRPAFHPRSWMPLLRDTLVFAVAVAVNAIYFRVALVTMSLVTTELQTGYFAISFRVMEVLIGLPGLLMGAAFPIVSRTASSDPARFQYAAGRMFELSVLLGTISALCLGLVAPFGIQLLTGNAHHPSVEILQIQSAALLATFIATAVGFPLLGMRRYREALWANLASLVVVAVLTLALAPSLGARGAAIAAVIGDFTLAIGVGVLMTRDGGPTLSLSVLPIAFVAAGCGYGAAVLVGIHPLVEAAVAAVVYLAVLVVLRRFPPEVRELLSRRPAGAAPASR